MIEVRNLTKNDQSALKDLLKNKRSLLKEATGSDDVVRIANCIDSPLSEVVGIWENGNLSSVAAVHRWRYLPYYTIANLFINTNNSVVKYNKFINLFMDRITQKMEAEGRHQFFILTLLRSFQSTKTSKNHMWYVDKKYTAFHRYDVYIEVIIPAGEKSEFNSYWTMMGEKTWPRDVWIRRYSLKNEYVISYYNKKSR